MAEGPPVTRRDKRYILFYPNPYGASRRHSRKKKSTLRGIILPNGIWISNNSKNLDPSNFCIFDWDFSLWMFGFHRFGFS